MAGRKSSLTSLEVDPGLNVGKRTCPQLIQSSEGEAFNLALPCSFPPPICFGVLFSIECQLVLYSTVRTDFKFFEINIATTVQSNSY